MVRPTSGSAGPPPPGYPPGGWIAWILPASVCLLLAIQPGDGLETRIFLPGTQPGSVDTVSPGSLEVCATCHQSASDDRGVSILGDWAGSMMAQSARDPVFYAALAVANKYSVVTGNNVGEYCIRCHSPTGWLAGRSEDVSGGSLRGTDLDGIQCDYCHRLVDPLRPDTSVPPTVYPVPGYGNGMHTVQKQVEPRRGPRDPSTALHPAVQDSFQSRGDLCGICHDVSNPFHTDDQERLFAAPHEYAPLERTYSEWLMSAYASEGPDATCQGCHMNTGGGYASTIPPSPFRADLAAHDLTGGNTFVPGILRRFWPGLDSARLAAGAARAAATLRRAAEISATVERSGDTLIAVIRVLNLTGHKLPTGYPEGRRMWLSLTATDAAGDTVYRSGAYDMLTGRLDGDGEPKVYEAVHGLTDSAAARYGLTPGASFFFSLNDTILFDNRIPPRGFTNAGFLSRKAAPAGAVYADGTYWDDTRYTLPGRTLRIEAALYYQSLTEEYAAFLRDENAGNAFDWNDWGGKLYRAWEEGGRSSPVMMDSLRIELPDTPTTDLPPERDVPDGYALYQNYPNPFNGSTMLRYRLGASGDVRVELSDVTGRRVRTLVSERQPEGEHLFMLNAPDLPSGIYAVTLTAGGKRRGMKILLIR